MKLLVLGGTRFVGRHLVLSARAAGIDVTLFNRGRTNPELFSDCEHIVGDRESDLELLEGRRWDAVIDVNGYVPRIVGAAVEALTNACNHYTYISTISVYGDVENPPDEDTPVATLTTETEDVTPETYGPLKASCEAFVRARAGEKALIVRPGIVAGPYDPTERFVRWIRRAADGGEMLAPGGPQRRVQYLDGRDLADWVVRMILRREVGTYNAVGPQQPLTMGELLETCVRVTAAGARLTWVPDEFLEEAGVEAFSALPLWAPTFQNAILQTDARRAEALGLTFRPVDDTVRATLAWDAARPERGALAGLSLERERELLAAFAQAS